MYNSLAYQDYKASWDRQNTVMVTSFSRLILPLYPPWYNTTLTEGNKKRKKAVEFHNSENDILS